MRVVVLCVGKQRTQNLDQAIGTYLERLGRHVVVDVVAPSDVETESKVLLARLQQTDYVVLLDETGKQLTSPKLAEMIDSHQIHGTKQLVFVVGGAFGVNQSVQARADMCWSLSDLVFPHELVRLLVVEQLYRAYDILRGGKYHHD